MVQGMSPAAAVQGAVDQTLSPDRSGPDRLVGSWFIRGPHGPLLRFQGVGVN